MTKSTKRTEGIIIDAGQISRDMIADIRRFNRYYTNTLGVMDRHILGTGHSWAEARVIIEIGIQGECIANSLVDALAIDRSYMSRIVTKLCKLGYLIKQNSDADSRVSLLRLSPKGLDLYHELNERSDEQILLLMRGLSEEDIREIHASIMKIQEKLDKREK